MQRARDLWWIVLFVVVLAGAWFFRGGLILGLARDRSGAPEWVLDLPDCYQSMDDPYAGPFSSHDCMLYENRGTVIHLRFSPPTGELEGEMAVDYYAGGDGKHDILREQHLTAYDYPLFVRNGRLFRFVPVSRDHRAQIAVWRWDPTDTEHMMHIGDLPYGAVANVHEDYFAVTQDNAPGPWQATLFHVRDDIERIGTFRVTGDRFENCRASAVAHAITAAGLSADQLKICGAFHANDQGPRAHRDGVPVDSER